MITRIVAIIFLAATLAHAKPNVILIVADDMGYSDVGCYGGEIQTPSIDALAKSGIRFSQFYNNARCCPTRASLMTGLYPHQAGVGAMCQDLGNPAYRGEISKEIKTLPEVLKANGYRTAMVGKWHLSNLTISVPKSGGKQLVNFEREAPISPSTASWPCNRGFEEHFGTIAGVGSFFDPYSLVHNETPIKPDKDFFYTDFITQHAKRFIEDFAKGDKPFFLYVAYTAPHWPMQTRSQTHPERYKVGWDNIRDARLKKQIELGLLPPFTKLSPRASAAWEDAPDKDWEAARMAVYASMIEEMDRGIGEIVASLGNRRDDTLVIFLSDNGGCAEDVKRDWYDIPTRTRDGREIRVGNDPKVTPGDETTFQSYGPDWASVSNTPFRRFKHFTEEGGIAAPCIISWPASLGRSNKIETKLGHVIDVMPTILAACEVPRPTTDGANLLGKTHTALFWEHEGNRAVRIGNYKLLAAHKENWQLYDLSTDRTELNDLAAKMPGKARELQEAYDAWAARVGVLPWPVKK